MQKSWKRVFLVIWSGQFISILTSSIVEFAIILWITMQTRSAEVLAISAIASMLPSALLGPFAGILVDRWPRKVVMIAADSFIALCTLLLAVLFYFGNAEIYDIYILMALRSVGDAFHEPAMQASVPLLAPKEELMRISGINQVIRSVCSIAGPALGALAISLLPMTPILMLDVGGAFVACVSLLFVAIPNPKREGLTRRIHVMEEIREAYRSIRKQRGVGWLFILCNIAMFVIIPLSVLYPLMTLDHFRGNAYEVSVVEIFWGSGTLLGGLLLSLNKRHPNEMNFVWWAILLIGLLFVISGLLNEHGFIPFAILTAFTGICGSVYMASFTTIIQKQLPPAVLGRVMSLAFSIGMLPTMFGLLGTGFLVDYIGLTKAFLLGGILLTLIGLLSSLVPSLQDLKNRLKE